YLFDLLEAGTYRVQFVLTDDQAELYEFTQLRAGDDPAIDSDADVADDPATGVSAEIVLDDDNEFLTLDYDREVEASEGVDPTWDAGVNHKPEPDEPGEPGDATDEQEPSGAV